jgi:hypothetical protein
MSKLVRTTLATVSLLFIAGCDQAPNAPAGAVATPPPAPGPLAPLSGGTSLPKFTEWPLNVAGIVTEAKDAFVVDGDNSRFGYQISSPLIEVKPGSDFIVRIDYTVESGSVCPGVLTGNLAAWIVPASTPTTDLRFNSGSDKGVVVVMANCNQEPQGNPKSKFRLKSAVIAPAAK